MSNKKCIILSRVSTEQQDLIQQTNAVKEEAKKQGYTEENIIIIEDKESAVKLSEEERNGLNSLKSYIINDPTIDCVFTYEISRISRQAKIVFSIRDFLINHNVQLIVMNPYFKMLKDDGTLSETSNIFFGIFASMAENEGYIRKARFKRGKEKLRQMGKWTGGKILFGYDVNHKTKDYIPHPKDSEIVKEVFRRYINEDVSTSTLARQMRDEGNFLDITLLSAEMKISRILSSPEYTGDDFYPPLITSITYEQARSKASQNFNGVKRSDKKKVDALCNGILRQENNGYLMTYAHSRNCYVANNRFIGKENGMKYLTVKKHLIEPHVWEIAVKLHKKFNTNSQNKLIERLVLERYRLYIRIQTIESQIDKLLVKINRIEERWLDDKITNDKRDELRYQTEEEIRHLQNDKKQCGLDISDKNSQLTKLRNRKVLNYDNLSFEEKVSIIKDVIKVIYISRQSYVLLTLKVYNNYNDDINTYQIKVRRTTPVTSKMIEVVG